MSRGPLPGPARGTGFRAPAVEAPEPPAWLGELALAEWARVVPELLKMRMLAEVDAAALAAYCQATAELTECTAVLDREGRFVTEPVQSAKGELLGERTKPHPALAAQRDAFGRVKAYLAEFGLTPAARARLRVLDEAGDGGSKLAALLKTVAHDAA